LPTPETLNSYSDRGDYLQQARIEQIGWLPLSDDAFVQAVETNSPILLVSGAEWSQPARKSDRLAFADADLQALISSDFVPVRVDCDENPEWLNAYFPVSKYALGLMVGNQSYFVSKFGAMYDFLPSGTLSEHIDDVAVTQDLMQARNQSPANAIAVAKSQVHQDLLNDINLIMAPHQPVPPSFSSEVHDIETAIDPHFGGTPTDEMQVLVPQAYRFLMMMGDKPALYNSLGRVLSSPLRDWLDGGFFRACDKGWTNLQFDKVTVSNAEMMLACADYGELIHSPYATEAATATFDCLLDKFVQDHGLLGSCRVGDEGPDGRSLHSSFSAKDIRDFWNTDLLTEGDRHWAIKYLNLDLAKNPQLVPFVADPTVFNLQRNQLRSVLADMKVLKREIRPRYGIIGYADVNGFSAARMLESARLWGDDRIDDAQPIKDALELLRRGDNLDHWLRQHHGGPELTDYLGYADAALQFFLARGDGKALNQGLHVLLEAKRIFELSTPGAWLMARSSPRGLPKDYLTPEVADNLYESCTAREIRLMIDYSRLLAGNPNTAAISSELAHDARAAILQCEPAAAELGIHAAGYYCAALSMERPYAFAVGRSAVEMATELYRLRPLDFVAPAKGHAREDLQRGPTGLYVVKDGMTLGPFATAAGAAKEMN
jgi:uncharacterized protein YyaL (SSP411 family)